MDSDFRSTTAEKNDLVDTEKKQLVIFKTENDKYGRDITVMSDFFDGYLKQLRRLMK